MYHQYDDVQYDLEAGTNQDQADAFMKDSMSKVDIDMSIEPTLDAETAQKSFVFALVKAHHEAPEDALKRCNEGTAGVTEDVFSSRQCWALFKSIKQNAEMGQATSPALLTQQTNIREGQVRQGMNSVDNNALKVYRHAVLWHHENQTETNSEPLDAFMKEEEVEVREKQSNDPKLQAMLDRTLSISTNEAKAMDIPDPIWLVDGMLSGEGISLWVAKHGTGKSHDLTYIGHCLNNGLDCFGRETGEPKNVVYFEVENGRNAILRRLQKMPGSDHSMDILSEPMLNLASSEDQFRLVDYLRAVDAEVLVIDPTMPLIHGDKSEEEVMGMVLSFINRQICKRMGIPVILAHHTNRSESYFGSIAWMNYACSAFIKQNAHQTHIEYDDGGITAKTYEATMKCLKQREGWQPGAIDNGDTFIFNQTISGTTITCSLPDEGPTDYDKALQWLKDNPDHGLAKTALRDELAVIYEGGTAHWTKIIDRLVGLEKIACPHGKPVQLLG